MSLVVGVTGPSGAGKSVACRAAEELGFQVINCDKVAHFVLENDSECVSALVGAFGNGILSGDKIDRQKLAAVAFGDKESTALLNRTALPFIVKAVKVKMQSDKILLDAPTLIQSGMQAQCNVVIGVLSDKEIRIKRIIERDGISESAAQSRISAAPDDQFFMENCDYIVYNNKDAESFVTLFKDLLLNIKEKIG